MLLLIGAARVGRLADALTHPDVRPRVVGACTALVGSEVAARGGLTGIAVRAGYRAVTAMRPTMVRDVLDALLPDFAAALEPLHDEAPGRFEEHLIANRERAARALLGVTDARIERTRAGLRKVYSGLRGIAQGQLEASVPALARTLAAFVPAERRPG